MTEALLGIDVGTSSCKALLIDGRGRPLASAAADYPLAQPRPGWTEQDPALWVEGARAAVGAALATSPAGGLRVIGIGLSGQMHGLTPLDAAGQVLRPAILWNDQRNAAECAMMTEAAGGAEALLRQTNNRMLVGYTGGKILWMKRHEPDLFRRLRYVLNPKDYLRLVLTGEIATEVSDASGTGLFDVAARTWARPLIEDLDLDPALLPPAFESAAITGRLSAAGARLLGLPAGIPVVGGGGDSVIQTLGSGVIVPGELQTTIGTAGILAAALETPRENPQGRAQIFCNVLPGGWHAMGVSLNAGGSLSWLRQLAGGFTGAAPSFGALLALAESAPPGARGLLFLPYLNGERCPHSDPDARATLLGLTARHGAADVARAVVEGVVHSLRDIHGLLQEAGVSGTIIKASGGGARAALWRQIQADLFGCPVVTTESAADGAALGAALVAGLGLGLWPDAAAIPKPRELTRQESDARRGAVYRRGQEIYRGLHALLAEPSRQLAEPIFEGAA